jgi:fumarate hydratase class I
VKTSHSPSAQGHKPKEAWAKGNRSQQVTDACKKHGGFYLGSIGGPAAVLPEQNIKKVECIDFPELGMEAVNSP